MNSSAWLSMTIRRLETEKILTKEQKSFIGIVAAAETGNDKRRSSFSFFRESLVRQSPNGGEHIIQADGKIVGKTKYFTEHR